MDLEPAAENDPYAAFAGGFNAKRLSAPAIVRDFVPPVAWASLTGPDHAFLVGPRGCGKTTLLRMLSPECLNEWTGSVADATRSNLGFSGVFVNVDRLWSDQVRPTNRAITELEKTYGKGCVQVAGFSTQICIALIETLNTRVGLEESGRWPVGAELSHQAEVSLASDIAELWQLTLSHPGLDAILSALERRLLALAAIVGAGEGTEVADLGIGNASWLAIRPIAAVATAVRRINRACKQPGHRWALLVDEIELAPASVHRELVETVRAGTNELILKLSFSPFDRLASSTEHVGALEANDFRAIRLWNDLRRNNEAFTRGIWDRVCLDVLDEPVDPETVLGRSIYDAPRSTRRSSYTSGSPRMEVLLRASRSDPGLRGYLSSHGIILADVDNMTDDVRSKTLRKAYPLVLFRDSLLRFSSAGARRRPKPKPEAFAGVDTVFAALEGNPRWMKYVFHDFLQRFAEERGRAVSAWAQYETLRRFANRFEALLSVAPIRDAHSSIRVTDIVNPVAWTFHTSSLGEFTVDPVGTFGVSKGIDTDVAAALQVALEAGAVIHVPGPSSPTVLDKLDGETFRLAYLLGVRPNQEFPMRKGRSRSLSAILEEHNSRKRQGKRRRATPRQGELF